MGKKKLYKAPEAEIIFIHSMNLLEASFSEQLENTDPLTDPEEIL